METTDKIISDAVVAGHGENRKEAIGAMLVQVAQKSSFYRSAMAGLEGV